MSPARIAIAVTVGLVAAGLTGWQYSRLRQIEACTSEGKVWNGPTSACGPARPSPILERDLRRS